MTGKKDPLFGEAPQQIPLTNAPLDWVIAQIKFNTVFAVNDPAYMAKFQSALRDKYPILSREQTLGFTPSGEVAPELVSRFSDLEKNWRVSIHPNFVSLEVRKYTSRENFLDRISFVINTVQAIFNPSQVTRIGVRYIDRITGDAYREIGKLICPQLLGLVQTELFPKVNHSASEATLSAAEGVVALRWGKISAGMGIDIGIPMPVTEDSWIIDIDLADESAQDFVPAKILERAGKFCERIYAIFRWVVTDDFIRYYGGKL